MSDDLLALATRALRDETAAPGASAAATRQRVVSSLRARRSRRASRVGLAVVLVAAAVGSSAWAAVGHLHSVSLWLGLDGAPRANDAASVASRVPAASGTTAAPAEVSPLAASAPSAEASVEAPLPLAEVEPLAAHPESASDPRAPAPPSGVGRITAPGAGARDTRAALASKSTPAASPAAAAAPSPVAAPPSPVGSSAAVASASIVVDPDATADALYTRAHAIHFQAHDDAAALRAWDAYLRAAPRGRYAVVARYNRAMCLARLGRAAEADAALRPFADGAEGGYRQGEARALRDALQGGR